MDTFTMDNKNPDDKESRRRLAAETRKANKPLMEKRRRERINTCLDQLKDILMDATKKESSYYSKLEKADILEMTVKYLKNLKRQQMSPTGPSPTSTVAESGTLNKYIAGFNECTHEVSRYLNSVHGLNDDIRGNMLGHLADCLHKGSNVMNANIAPVTSLLPLATQAPPAATASASSNQRPSTSQQLQIQTQPTMLANAQGNLCILSPATPSHQTTFQSSPMQLVPANLPTGETVFVLASAGGSLIGSNLNIAPVIPSQPPPPPPQNVISLVNSSMDTINGNPDSKKWSTPHQSRTALSPFIPCSSGPSSTKPSTISKSPPSDDETVFDIRSCHIKTSSPLLSDHNANLSDQQSSFIMPSYTPIISSTSSTFSRTTTLSQTPTSNFSFLGQQIRTPKSSFDDSRNESVSSTSDASISSPVYQDTERSQRHSSSSSSLSSAQQNPQFDHHSTSLLDPMWRPW